MKLEIPTSDAMERLGESLALVAKAGDVIILTGELGAGKTTFARGFGRALHLTTPMSSPTFVVARTHQPSKPGEPPVVHIDAYRIGSVAEMAELDVDAESSIVLAEWAAPYASALSDSWLEIVVERPVATELLDIESDEPRQLSLSAHGVNRERYEPLIAAAGDFS
jgi:tRNA threonylcarbamoyl adenosine modification protein YjeE